MVIFVANTSLVLTSDSVLSGYMSVLKSVLDLIKFQALGQELGEEINFYKIFDVAHISHLVSKYLEMKIFLRYTFFSQLCDTILTILL